MYTLGLNAVYHDCAAALVADGEVIAAAEEERFSHVKRPVPFTTWQLPFHAIEYCLREAGIRLADVDCFAYSYDPRAFAGAADVREPTILLPLEPSAQPRPDAEGSPWDPLFLSYIV